MGQTRVSNPGAKLGLEVGNGVVGEALGAALGASDGLELGVAEVNTAETAAHKAISTTFLILLNSIATVRQSMSTTYRIEIYCVYRKDLMSE